MWISQYFGTFWKPFENSCLALREAQARPLLSLSQFSPVITSLWIDMNNLTFWDFLKSVGHSFPRKWLSGFKRCPGKSWIFGGLSEMWATTYLLWHWFLARNGRFLCLVLPWILDVENEREMCLPLEVEMCYQFVRTSKVHQCKEIYVPCKKGFL